MSEWPEWRDGKRVEAVCDSWCCDFHLGDLIPRVRGKPTIPDVIPFVKTLYRFHPTGCCLHIVLDDGNTDRGDVQFCREQAIDAKHVQCERLALVLLKMSATQRNKLHRKILE